jgi:cell division protease FtsH
MDEAISKILADGYHEAKRILTEKREAVERVTRALLEQETLTRDEFAVLI